ncbi:MAG: DsbA family protein [Deltaproteobacteria bacterium]|nr:DsbA family protein [Deltaproteobacteria bacterium]
MFKRLIIAFALLFFVLSVPQLSSAKDMTEETGQEILKELKDIKALWEKALKPPAKAERPQPKSGTVSLKGSSTLGDKDAPVTLVEFTDYQCPFCKKFYDATFQEIKKKYIDTGKVLFVSRNLPLPFHGDAKKAAQAVSCAGDQGKYWEMRDEVFKNSRALKSDDLASYAKGLSLKMNKFNSCVDSDKHMDKIEEDIKAANSYGIGGTPSFMIGLSGDGNTIEGTPLIGAQPIGAFDAAIERLLKK